MRLRMRMRLSPWASICFHFVLTSAGRLLWNNGDTDSQSEYVSASGSAGRQAGRKAGSQAKLAMATHESRQRQRKCKCSCIDISASQRFLATWQRRRQRQRHRHSHQDGYKSWFEGNLRETFAPLGSFVAPEGFFQSPLQKKRERKTLPCLKY